MGYFQRGLLINAAYYCVCPLLFTGPHRPVSHAEVKHSLSECVFARGHCSRKEVLSIYTGKLWSKVLEGTKGTG